MSERTSAVLPVIFVFLGWFELSWKSLHLDRYCERMIGIIEQRKGNSNLNQVHIRYQVHIRAAGEVRKRGGEDGRKLPKALITRMVRIRLKTEVMIMVC